jgi:hypothetical protein
LQSPEKRENSFSIRRANTSNRQRHCFGVDSRVEVRVILDFLDRWTRQIKLGPTGTFWFKNNPYFDPAINPKATIAKPRKTRELLFNQKGKYWG